MYELLLETWDTYAQLSRRKNDKHSRRCYVLDKFLKLFLEIADSSAGPPQLSNMNNVCNHLCQELMNDILFISNNTHDESDASGLEKYLLHGHGWMLLKVIHHVGVKNLSNCRDLCNLLLSLLPWCKQFQSVAVNTVVESQSTYEPVLKCFKTILKLSKLKSFGCSVERKHKSDFHDDHLADKKKILKRVSNTNMRQNTDSEDNSCVKTKPKHRHTRTKRGSRVNVYKLTVLQNENESDSDQDLMDSFTSVSGLKESISSADLCLVILQVLQDLCLLDLENMAPGKCMSSVILPHLLHFLSQLPDMNIGSEESVKWSREVFLFVQNQLVNLVFIVSAVVAMQQNGIQILLTHRIVDGLLKSVSSFLETSAVGEHTEKENGKCQLTELERQVFQETVCGIVLLLEVILHQLTFNLSFINSALCILNEFKQSNGFQFVKILLTEFEGVDSEAGMNEELLKYVSSFIHTLKLVKVNYIHAVRCVKRYHRNCNYRQYLHHHHDILGLSFISDDVHGTEKAEKHNIPYTKSRCLVAEWIMFLLDVLGCTKSKKMQIQLLSVLRFPGICCCMQPKILIERLVPMIPAFSVPVYTFCLEVLNEILLEQFLGMEDLFGKKTSLRSSCQLCSLEGDLPKLRHPDSLQDLGTAIDSGFSSVVAAQDEKKQKSLKRWQPLQLLKLHIITTDESLALAVAKHLMVLAIRGNNNIKEQLFFKIYQQILHWPVDESLSSLTDTSSDEQASNISISSSVLMYCVSALPYLLQVDIVMNAFLEKKGLARLAELMEEEHLRAPVMSVFEALIMIDEQKVQEEKRNIDPEVSKFTSDYSRGTVMQMFTESLAKKTCQIMADLQRLGFSSYNDIPETDPSKNQTDEEQNETCIFQHHKNIVKNIPILLDMWKTCAKLCMNSPTFQTYYRNSPCLYIVQDTLLLVLDILTGMSKLTTFQCCEKSSNRQNISFSCHLRQLAFIEAVMIVCFSCSTISPTQKKGSEEKHWCQLRESLQRCVNLEPGKLKAVFEMLLSAAQPQLSSVLEYSYNQIIAMLNLQDSDDHSDDEDFRLLDMSPSDRDDETVYTEQGYEADTEISQSADWKKEVYLSKKKNSQVNAKCFPSVFRLFMELAVSCKNTQSGKLIMTSVLQRFLQLLRKSPLAVHAVCSEGILQLMFEGFRENLIEDPHDSNELTIQEILLSVFQLLSQKELTPQELSSFMQFFLSKHSASTKEFLLSSLMNVVEHIQETPDFTLTFPVAKKLPPKPKDSTGTEKLSQLCCCQKRSWGQSAVHCFISSGLPWPPIPIGFSIALWLNIDESSKPTQLPQSKMSTRFSSSLVFSSLNADANVEANSGQKNDGPNVQFPVTKCLHLISLGKEDKTFEIWVDVTLKRFIFRITSTTSENEILKEECSDRVLSPGKWQHIVFCYEECLNGSTLIGKLNILIDGWLSREIMLDYPASSYQKQFQTPPTACFGHIENLYLGDQGQYHIGNLMIFKGVDFSKEWWFHHLCLGPNLSSVSKCDCADLRAVYTPHLVRDIFCESGLSIDVLVGSLTVSDVEKARKLAVLTYQPKYPNSVLYQNSSSLLEMDNHSIILKDPLIYQMPEVLSPVISGLLLAEKHNTIEKAIEQIGGIGIFLFLVAKIYEDTMDIDSIVAEKLQSRSIQLLFAAVHHMPLLAAEFVDLSGYSMLGKIICTSRCTMGFEVLKAFLNSCTTESVFRPDASSTRPLLRLGTEAVVSDVAIIEQLLLSWHIMDHADEGVIELLFQTLKVLVRPGHPYRNINIKQYKASNILMKIFLLYLERIQEQLPSLSTDISMSVLSIISSLLGSPPDLHLLVNVTDFLLLVHPAASAYVNHSDSNMFFKCWWAFPSATSTPLKTKTQTGNSQGKNDSSPKESMKRLFSQEETTSESDTKSKTSQTKTKDIRESSLSSSQKSSLDEKLESDASSVSGKEFPPRQCLVAGYVVNNSDGDYCRKSQSPSTDNETSTDLDMFSQKQNLPQYSQMKHSPKGDEITTDDVNVIDVDGNGGSSVGVISQQISCDSVAVDIENVNEIAVDFDSVGETEDDKDIGLTTLVAGLLNYLHKVILDIPESSLDMAFATVLDPDMMIVLAHNNSPQIRSAVIRLIAAYVRQASPRYLEKFLKVEGFYLLASQLHQYPAQEEHVEAALSIFLGQDFSFEEGCSPECFTELTPVQQCSSVVFLSLLEKTAHNVALCHNSLEILHQMITISPILSTLFLEQGLAEVLCNLIAVVQKEDRPTDIVGRDESQLILLDIQNILCMVAENEFSCSGMNHYQQVEDLVSLLKILEENQTACDGGEKNAEHVRIVQMEVINTILNYIEKQSEEFSQQPLSWFSVSSGNANTGGYGNHNQSPRTFRLSTLQSLITSHPSHLTHKRALGTLSQTDKFTDVPFDEKSYSSINMDISSDSLKMRSAWKTSSLNLSSISSQSATSSRLSFLFGKNKKIIHTVISQSELLDRLKKFLLFVVNLVVLKDRTEVKKPEEDKSQIFATNVSSLDDNFLTKLFTFTYKALECTLDKSGYNRRTRNVIFGGAKDLIRQQFSRLLLCMMSAKVNFNVRLFALSFIMGESHGREIVKMCASVHPVGIDLSFYVFDLLTTWREWLVGPQRGDGCGLLNILRQLGYTIFRTDEKLTEEKKLVLTEDKRNIDMRMLKEKHLWQQKRETVIQRILHRFDKHAKLLSGHAMDVTRRVTQLQNIQRKNLIEHIKKNLTEQIQLKQSWQKLIQNLTHERSVWYHRESYPRSWQLDPTEGPGRMRRRLQRNHLEIDPKFLSADYKKNVDSENTDPPLIFLFQDANQMSDAAALIYRHQTNEKIHYTCRCMAVSPASENKGELLVGEMSIFFVADEAITDANYTQVLIGNKDQLSMKWPHVDIKEIHQRRYQLLDIGLEIFLTSGKTYLLAFKSSQERNELQSVLLESLELPNLIQSGDLAMVQKFWLDGNITNYDYLTYLNKMAGRSFNDLMQYPVFPFILSDYCSVELDLTNPDIYRDLSKPIAVQEKSREKKYRENYEFLKQEYEKDPGQDSSIRIRPYHYGSHYSNSGTVLHYLVRLPPFTKMFLSYQDDSFDIPDRTFHSVATSWRLSSFESASDVKELIPEFFFLPEFLVNSEGFEFGKRQNGEVVSDVILPPWSMSDARLFVLIHRQALESTSVTQNIHQWINLVFGYKQQGEESIKAINVFHPSTYFGIDVGEFTDPLKRQAILTMICTYGQTPKQLFQLPHPANTAHSSVSASAHSVPRTAAENERRTYIPRLKNVSGLKWGNCLWNPEGMVPVPTWQHTYTTVFTSLVPIPTGYMFGLEEDACVLVLHGKDKADIQCNATDVMWAGIVSWGFQDGILRVKNQITVPAVNFIRETCYDDITCCASVPDCRLFFTAGSTGIINVYNVAHNKAKASHLQVLGSRMALIGHTDTVNVMVISKAFSVIVTGSEDGTIIVWDLNRLSYILSITSHPKGVKTLAVSDTLGDIVSVSPRALGSYLQLHTINGRHVVSRKCDEFSINCLAYSIAPEGRSINVVAGGLSTGVIRLWNSWDLSHLIDLQHEFSIACPVVSVAFTHDCQRLFASAEDGTVTMWEKPSSRTRPHHFQPFQKLGNLV